MGSGMSQSTYDVLDEDQSRSPDPKPRTLPREFDPRSPSDGIFRTPIQIAATPVQLQDPRSPSMDIERTPIYPVRLNGDNEACKKYVENIDIISSLTTTVVAKRDPGDAQEIPLLDLSITEPLQEEIVPQEVCKKNAENFDIISSLTTTIGVRRDLGDGQEVPLLDLSITEPLQEELVPPGVEFPPPILTESVIHADCEEVQADKIHGESQKVKQLLQPNPMRSPLTARNNNNAGSLRSTVQLREAKKAEIFRCAQTSDDLKNRKLSTVNKENM